MGRVFYCKLALLPNITVQVVTAKASRSASTGKGIAHLRRTVVLSIVRQRRQRLRAAFKQREVHTVLSGSLSLSVILIGYEQTTETHGTDGARRLGLSRRNQRKRYRPGPQA